MKVAIVGSNSFLAEYIIRILVRHNIEPALYGTTSSIEFPLLEYTAFKFPEQPIDYKDLLEYDAVIYTAGAGIQANLNETTEIIYELNSFLPIRLATMLSVNNFKGKLITFGSYFEIGNETTERYYSENEVISSVKKVPNDYCASKRILSRFFSNDQNLDFYHLILPNIYGKGENPQRIIPYLINSLKNNEDIKLTSGEQVRQYIHATDVAKTIFDIINENYQKGFYNLCRPEPIQIKELVKKIFDLCGQKDKFGLGLFGANEKSDTSMPYLLLNNAKALHTFKYQPEILIEEGIKTYLK
jgi:nucleoside-diphosphate-sugar epimerase